MEKILVTLASVELFVAEHSLDADDMGDFDWLSVMVGGSALLCASSFDEGSVVSSFELQGGWAGYIEGVVLEFCREVST